MNSTKSTKKFNESTLGLKAKKGLSYDVGSGSEKTPCIKIDKPLVVYRFSGTCNIMK